MIEPSIVGPETHPRDTDETPGFSVAPGEGRFYAVEVATAFVLFWDTRARTKDTFFGSWQGGGQLLTTASPQTTFILPYEAWVRLRPADVLYYRLVTSSSETAWRDATTSVGADAAAPPQIQLRGRFVFAPPSNFRSEELLWRRDPSFR